MARVESKAVSNLLRAAAVTQARRDLIKRTYGKGATDDEFALFLGIAERTGLDIAARQIFLIKRWDSKERREIMQPQTSIDGLRLIADRSGKYEGQTGPFWCGSDGLWRDVWIPDDPPVAARVGALKTGCREPFWGVAKYAEYTQRDKEGKVTIMWRKMPGTMLAKCAEALALRKAFPQEMSGLYTSDELPPPEPPAEAVAPVRPWTNYKGMLDVFADLKARLGPDNEAIYYAVLKQDGGVNHANEFRPSTPGDAERALKCYVRLYQIVEEREAANFPEAQTMTIDSLAPPADPAESDT